MQTVIVIEGLVKLLFKHAAIISGVFLFDIAFTIDAVSVERVTCNKSIYAI